MGIETKRKRRTLEDWHTVFTGKANHWEATDWCTRQFGQRWSVVRQQSWHMVSHFGVLKMKGNVCGLN
jgi:hypothetical protein